MTRRSALHVLSAVVGAMTGRHVVAAEPAQSLQVGGTEVLRFTNAPLTPSLAFNLASFTEYRFSLKGETITITPEELFSALKEKA